MSRYPSLPRYSQLLTLLRASLVVGGLYDLILAMVLVLAPGSLARLLALPPPGEDFYLWLMAVMMGMLGGFYLLAAYDPMAYQGNIRITIAGRTAAGLVLALAARVDLAGLYFLAAIELVFASVHFVFWWPVRRRGA